MKRKDIVSKKEKELKHTLKINLISMQNLKPPCANLCRMQNYTLIWVDPDHNVKTQTDCATGKNPVGGKRNKTICAIPDFERERVRNKWVCILEKERKKKEKERSYLDLKMDNREKDGAKSDMKREGKKKKKKGYG